MKMNCQSLMKTAILDNGGKELQRWMQMLTTAILKLATLNSKILTMIPQ